MTQAIIITMTSTKEDGLKIARSLVDENLAACVNIIDKATSVYRWKEQVCEEEEFLLIIKSKNENFSKIKERILQLHPYDLPEVIMLEIDAGHQKYLDWIDNNS